MRNLSDEIYDAGFNAGYEDGLNAGIDLCRRQTAVRLLLNSDFTEEEIAKDTKLSLETVQSLKADLTK